MMKFTLALALFAQLALAGNEGGNSGTGVACGKQMIPLTFGEVETVSLLDYFEAKLMMPGFEVAKLGSEENQQVEKILDRLKSIDPLRAERYLADLKTFFKPENVFWVQTVEMPLLQDLGYFPLPENCRLVQAIIHQEPVLPEDRPFIIQKDIWSRLDVSQKAGALLHEIVYADALRYGQTNSELIRKFVALVSWSSFDSSAQTVYHSLVKEIFRVPTIARFQRMEMRNVFEVGKPFSLSLSDYVIKGYKRDTTYKILENLPSWLTLRGGILQGTPPAEAPREITVNAFVETNGIASGTKLTLYRKDAFASRPRPLFDPIHITASRKNKVITVDLRELVKNSNGAQFFTREFKWMNLSRWGVLRIHPAFIGQNEAGAFEVPIFAGKNQELTSFQLTIHIINEQIAGNVRQEETITQSDTQAQ